MCRLLYLVLCLVNICYGYPCSPGELRLVNGSSHNSGRLEIYYDSSWGTICDDNFDARDAIVACRQLGYSSGLSLGNNVQNGIGQIILDDLNCIGNENSLIDCPHRQITTHDCVHGEDVGVECDLTIVRSVGHLRLVGLSKIGKGRLEIFYNMSWGTICNNEFDDLDAAVACRQLNFSSGYALPTTDIAEGNDKIWLSNVSCDGTENEIINCKHSEFGTNNCLHSQDVGVFCHFSADKMRLVGGSVPNSGRIEIFSDKSWTPITSKEWNDRNTIVACRQFGFRSGIRLSIKDFDCTNGSIWFNHLNCSGTEQRLDDCAFIKNSTCQTCYQSNYVEVFCFGSVDNNWSEWSAWGICRVPCNGGIQYRSRMCNTSTEICSDLCPGPSYQSQICNSHSCAVNGSWGEWSVWSDCTTTCDGGNKNRTRVCDSPSPSNGGYVCSGGQSAEFASCRTNSCPVNGHWGLWSTWTNPAPSYGGDLCNGSSTESLLCANTCCPVDGNWGIWGDWGLCNVSCGVGIQQRERQCNNPPPLFEGTNCSGPGVITKECNIEECLVGWGPWYFVDDCPVTCGKWIQRYRRNCSSSLRACVGSNTEIREHPSKIFQGN